MFSEGTVNVSVLDIVVLSDRDSYLSLKYFEGNIYCIMTQEFLVFLGSHFQNIRTNKNSWNKSCKEECYMLL